MNKTVTRYKHLTPLDYILDEFWIFKTWSAFSFSVVSILISIIPLIISKNWHLIISEPVILAFIGIFLATYTYREVSTGVSKSDQKVNMSADYQSNLYNLKTIIVKQQHRKYQLLVTSLLEQMNNRKRNLLWALVPSIALIPVGIWTFYFEKSAAPMILQPIWVLPDSWYIIQSKLPVLLSLHTILFFVCFVLFITGRMLVLHSNFSKKLSTYSLIGIPSLEINFFLEILKISIYSCISWTIGVTLFWYLFDFQVSFISMIICGISIFISFYTLIMPIIGIRLSLQQSKKKLIDDMELDLLNHKGDIDSTFMIKTLFIESQNNIGKIDKYILFLSSILLGPYATVILKHYNLIT